MTINERFFSLLANSGTSQKEFSLKTGIPTQTISGWKSRKTDPPANLISSIAVFFDVSVEYLLTGNSSINDSIMEKYAQLTALEKEKVKHFIEIALVSAEPPKSTDIPHTMLKEESTYNIVEKTIPILGIVAAGTPILSYESELDSIQSENKDASYALIAKGNSMNPIILDGETVEVISQQELKNGEIGIIKVDDEATCKRYYKTEDRIELRSLNQGYDPIIIFKNSSKNLQIVGKVILTRVQQSRF